MDSGVAVMVLILVPVILRRFPPGPALQALARGQIEAAARPLPEDVVHIWRGEADAELDYLSDAPVSALIASIRARLQARELIREIREDEADEPRPEPGVGLRALSALLPRGEDAAWVDEARDELRARAADPDDCQSLARRRASLALAVLKSLPRAWYRSVRHRARKQIER